MLLGLAMCSSCDHSFLFSWEGDCEEGEPYVEEPGEAVYKVMFKYDYNMNYTDAFAQEVSVVTLYLLDDSGNIVWQKSEEGTALARADYAMEVDVAPGTYSLLAWCGTKELGSFTVSSDLQCRLNRNYSAEGTPYVDTDLDRWFHGFVSRQVFPEEEGTYTYTVSLVKDTNLFHVVLQHESGSEIDADKFLFTITADNGLMDWDNTLLPDEEITYCAWYTGAGSAETEPYSTRATGSAAVADITTARLVTDHAPSLTVTNLEEGEVLFSVPLIDYALLVKDNYDANMGDQEFLDRQDEWEIVFFLDDGERWLNGYIYINSWKVVLVNTGF